MSNIISILLEIVEILQTDTQHDYCDLQGRNIYFTNSETLVGVAVSRPTVTRVTFDLSERKESQKMKKKRQQKKNKKKENEKKRKFKKTKMQKNEK